MAASKKILGGPDSKAHGHSNVYPTNFSETDPFWDVTAHFRAIEERIRAGETSDLIIVERKAGVGINTIWRGESPMTTAIGMIEYAKDMIIRSDG